MKAASSLRRLVLFPYQLFVLVVFFALLLLCSLGILFASLFDASGDRAHRCLTYWARVNLALAGLRVQIEGLQRLEPRGTYIFMPNHASFLDILLALACIPYNFRMITKEEMFRIPFIGWILKRSRQIPMNRTHPRKGLKSLRQASHLVGEGVSIVVFPEGTRTSNGGINEFKATLFMLPIRSGVPVVPVLIEGTFSALKRGSILLNPVPLKLTFHTPIPAGAFKEGERWLYAKQVREVLVSGVRENSNLEAR
ncbi:MAG: hypothetical protein A3G40_16380 [Deltaproteobacteria bacterium RIFCSPLOWO2_12_FULL_57_22]|nr:MAG: hypothetical protein A3G40_16380 [Deltaproteobacteria bacterium RIFCSPLOWO2_12_FULL_57_22]